MKNKKLWFVLISLCSLLLFAIYISSCEKADNSGTRASTRNKTIPPSVKKFIYSLNFDTTNIQDIGKYYVVENDIMLAKDLLNTYKSGVIDKSAKQARVSDLVSTANVHSITVRVDASIPTSGDDNWRGAVQAAIYEWNNIHSHLYMTYTTNSTADITVSSDNGSLNDGDWEYISGQWYWVWTLANASWPNGSKPGSTIIINLDTDSNRAFSDDQKKYNIVHEMGHCIGMRHTNWSGLGESTGIGISGTPNSGSDPDPNSVMNGGTALNSWNGFSTYDVVAIRALYPWIPISIDGPLSLESYNVGTDVTYYIDFGSAQPSWPCNWSISYNGGSSTSLPVYDPYITFSVANGSYSYFSLGISCPSLNQSATSNIELSIHNNRTVITEL
jgi:hypothetical protein